MKGKVELVCEICGKKYSKFHSQRASRFCSKACHIYYQKLHPELSKGRVKEDLRERLWRNIDVSSQYECWEWKLSRDKDGYGKIKVNGEHKRSHRIIWEMFNGTIPEGLQVCHTCDNPPCCNPNHLFLGTTQDNKQDSVRKRRHPHGETNGSAKLNEEDVWMIRRWWPTGLYTQKELASIMNVSVVTIDRIVNHRHWKCVMQ